MKFDQKLKSKLDYIFKEHFKLDLQDRVVNFECILRKEHKERFDTMKAQYEESLSSHPQQEEVKKRLYIDDEMLVYLQQHFESAELEGVSLEDSFYHPWCTQEEISRIRDPRCAKDMLLKLRADAIADNVRLSRVYLEKYRRAPIDWSLGKQFDDGPFQSYVKKLSPAHRELCQSIPAGFVFIKDPNGVCEWTEFGNIIYISESLRQYLYYMNMFLLAQDLEYEDRFHAFMIAVRTMLMTESLDFDIDPRGEVPEVIRVGLSQVVNKQLDFVIGHEYAHHILGHVGKKPQAKEEWAFGGRKRYFHLYNYKQMQEFDADYCSVQYANYNRREVSKVVNGAILFFLGLDLFECVCHYMYPPGRGVRKHPSPIDRMWRMQKKYGSRKGVMSVKELEGWVDYLQGFKGDLEKEFLPFKVEEFEMYGSVYLPSFKDRISIDRIDF